MDFFKKSCKELCEQLCYNQIKTKDELDKFIEAKCAEYDKKSKTNPKSDVIKKEKSYLKGIYKALEKHDTVEKLEELQKALEKLGSRRNVQFLSIFFGVGTGTYYREAAKEVKQEIAVKKVSNQQPESLEKESKKLQEKLQKITEEKKIQKNAVTQTSKETDNKKTTVKNKSIDPDQSRPYSVCEPNNKYLEELQGRLPTGLNEITNQNEVPDELIEIWCT